MIIYVNCSYVDRQQPILRCCLSTCIGCRAPDVSGEAYRMKKPTQMQETNVPRNPPVRQGKKVKSSRASLQNSRVDRKAGEESTANTIEFAVLQKRREQAETTKTLQLSRNLLL